MKSDSVQHWLPFKTIFDNGIIQLKDNTFVKILKVTPINFNLKSKIEKESILNSYKLFLKTCNIDIQIIIQSNKEDFSELINNIKIKTKNDNEKIKKFSQNYINFIQNLNYENKSSSKKFFILIKRNPQKTNINIINEEINSDYFKIKECLYRCGNIVSDVSTKEETELLLYSFLNTRDYFKNVIKE